MVSVLILGLFLVPLAISRNNVILMVGRTVNLRKARILAAQKIGELELENYEEFTGGSGDFGEENPGFFWEARVEILPLEEVVDLEEALTAEEETFTTLEEEEEDDEPRYEVVKLTLLVRHAADEGDLLYEEAQEETAEGEAKVRQLDRIVIVRYFLREAEEEEE